jgi:N utilization substance protein A
VESAMAALVPAGAPVSVLIDHGLDEQIATQLIESGIGTVEKLGSMTPEELEAIPGIGSAVVEGILIAVNAYYAQFEQTPESVEALAEERVPADEPAAPEALAADDGASPETAEIKDGHVSVPEKESDTIKDSGEVG